MSRGDVILRLVDVERIYETKEGRKIVALNKVTTSFKRGEFVAIVGKSGSGKSTLINILGGLDRPDGGDYFLEGNNIADINEGHWDAIRNEKIGFIFQEYHLVEYLSVYKNVEIALKYQNTMNRKVKDAKIKEVLTRVGIIDHMHKLPNQLSGGQRQRVAVARALVKDPAIILADEPTGALDHKTSENVIDMIKGLSKERLVLVVTHDRGIANNHATRIIELTDGKFTSDLIKEDIPQTYQNVYKKTKPTNLSLRDKFELTFRKLKSQLLRTLFTALSLALAFSFTILFNGVERGISNAYDAYYEALNKTNSFAFTLVSEDYAVLAEDYDDAQREVDNGFNILLSEGTEYLVGNNTLMASNKLDGGVEHVLTVPTRPDILGEQKLRLIDVNTSDKYSFDDLFIGDSVYPYDKNEIMVTSKFLREYLDLSDNVTSLNDYVGTTTINIPEYTFYIDSAIFNAEEYLNQLVEYKETEEIMTLQEFNDNILPTLTLEEDESSEDFYLKVRYLHMNIPDYCYHVNDLEEYYVNYCEDIIDNDTYARYFDSLDDYIAYVDDFKAQIDQIDDEWFDVLFRSGFVFYMLNENESNELYTPPGGQYYIERVYRKLIEAAEAGETAYIEDAIFKNQEQMKEMYITGIIDNENESIIYIDFETYNDLFIASDTVEYVPGYYSVNLASGISGDFDLEDFTLKYFAEPLNTVSASVQEEFEVVRTEYIEQGDVCAIYNVDNVLNEASDLGDINLLGDVFRITDYSGCKVNSETYHYLTSIRVLFGVFFNTLMIISIVFFNILLQVILAERIGEIGVYRSVGSTSKDVKYLFFIEILIEVVVAALMSIVIIYYANIIVNDVFLNTINQGSGVVNFAGMKLSLGENQEITSISFFNLLFYIVMVFSLLGFLSNRNVSKLANTKPIDILREVE